MPWYDSFFSDIGWQIEGRGIDDFLGQNLHVGMTDASWNHLNLIEKLFYEGLSREGRTNPDSPGVVYDPETGLPIYDPTSPIIWEQSTPPSDTGGGSSGGASGGGSAGGGGGSTDGGSGGGVRQIAPGVYIPENMGLIQALTQGLITREIFEQLSPRLQTQNPTQSPVQSTDAGGGGPRRSPVEQVFQTQNLETSTDAGGGGPRIFPSSTQSPTPSPDISTDAGGGGPRRDLSGDGGTGGGDGGGNGDGNGDGNGGGGDTPVPNPYKNMDWSAIESRIIPSTGSQQVPEMDAFLDAFGPLQNRTIDDQSDWMNRAYSNLFGFQSDSGLGGYYTGTGTDVLQAGQDALYGFMGGEGDTSYQGVVDATRAANPLIGSIQNQATQLGTAAQGVLDSAGVLNERERSNVQDQARALFGARGRGTDTAAIATEIGDVIEAERLDRNQDLGTYAGLMGAQQGAAETISGLQNQFVQPFFNAGQSLGPGLNVASNISNVAGSMGQDPWAMFGLEGQERQHVVGQQALENAADAADMDVFAQLLGLAGNAWANRGGGGGAPQSGYQWYQNAGAIPGNWPIIY